VRVHRGIATAVAALALAAAPAVAQAAFPGSDPDESVRVNTPDDPAFDHCESDDEQGADCSNVFDEEYERFGFAPDASEHTALYKNPLDTARQQEQNLEAGRNPLGRSRASAPTAPGSARPVAPTSGSRSWTPASAGASAACAARWR
jgi:hypothetical protein